MHKFIILPNGDAIRSDTIYAVRKFDARSAICGMEELPPRVVVEYGINGERPGYASVLLKTNEERDNLASSIIARLVQERTA